MGRGRSGRQRRARARMGPHRSSGLGSVCERGGNSARSDAGRPGGCSCTQWPARAGGGRLGSACNACRPDCTGLGFGCGLWRKSESEKVALLVSQWSEGFLDVFLKQCLMSGIDFGPLFGNPPVRQAHAIIIDRVIVDFVDATHQILSLQLGVLHISWPVLRVIGKRCEGQLAHNALVEGGRREGSIRVSRGGIYSMSRSSSWASSTAGEAWWTFTLGRRRRGPLLFAPESGSVCGAGVAKAAALALVVFMPNGARVRGPGHVC